jgi:hypothetical protein
MDTRRGNAGMHSGYRTIRSVPDRHLAESVRRRKSGGVRVEGPVLRRYLSRYGSVQLALAAGVRSRHYHLSQPLPTLEFVLVPLFPRTVPFGPGTCVTPRSSFARPGFLETARLNSFSRRRFVSDAV